MKKLLALVLVLSLATVASAALKISVNGVVDPADSSVEIDVSDWVTIDIWSDGTTNSAQMFTLAIVGGSYNIDGATNVVVPPGAPDSIFELEPGLIFVDLGEPLAIPPLPVRSGTVVDQILVHGDVLGQDVMLTLAGDISGELDAQVIHVVPEPITLALLGLGGLFIRRK